MRLIDADVLTGIINRYTVNTNPDNFNLNDKISYGIWMFHNGENAGFTNVQMAIDDAPTVDPVRHGYWDCSESELIGGHYHFVCRCTVCDYRHERREKYDFCPHCGARMDGAE